ncbi:hypothetical protein BDW74DRAFT_175665 [Aspergillus multicolor]|uniref:uncharacterized protein n=1 Tax=Aspergillus multicolor TaxID=41759 RepID=UPI003CCE1668
MAASLAAAAPNHANEFSTRSQLVARDDPVITVTFKVGLNATKIVKRSIRTQHECQKMNNLQGDGVFFVVIPDGWYCRFWESDRCNGGGTGDIHSQWVRQWRAVSSFKCYKDKN